MKSHILAPLLASTAVIVALSVIYPVNVDFYTVNPDWNGLTVFASEAKAVEAPLTTLTSLYSPQNYTILIIGPSANFTAQEAVAIKNFLAMGGTVVVMDDFGTANQLLSLLQVPARFSGQLMLDPLLNQGHPALPTAYWGNNKIALNYATTINITTHRNVRILAASSPFSYLDLNLNNHYDKDEPAGPFPIAVELNIGPGRLVLVSDPSILINTMVNREQNKQFVLYLLGGKTPAIDDSHWEKNLHAEVRDLLAKAWLVASSPEIKYSLAISLAVFVAILNKNLYAKKPAKS